MTQHNNGQSGPDFVQTEELLRDARPELSALRLDEIKRDALAGPRRSRGATPARSLRSRMLALTLFVMLFAISTSNAAAKALNWASAGSLGKTVGKQGHTLGTSFLFGSYTFGGDTSDDAGHETYCKDDKGSDDKDGSSGDNSDGDKGSDDRDGSSSDQSDEHRGGYGGEYSVATGGGDGGDDCDTDTDRDGSEKSDDNDKSSGDHSDEKSDDNDKSSGDNSDGDKYSDDNDASSDDHSDEKSDDNDASSDDHSDW